ncbi:hypothetical protein PWT90_02445 [Aphanocladium album]|nr:hypothetical protein PWT90_02445 [Aphanocladium album]
MTFFDSVAVLWDSSQVLVADSSEPSPPHQTFSFDFGECWFPAMEIAQTDLAPWHPRNIANYDMQSEGSPLEGNQLNNIGLPVPASPRTPQIDSQMTKGWSGYDAKCVSVFSTSVSAHTRPEHNDDMETQSVLGSSEETPAHPGSTLSQASEAQLHNTLDLAAYPIQSTPHVSWSDAFTLPSWTITPTPDWYSTPDFDAEIALLPPVMVRKESSSPPWTETQAGQPPPSLCWPKSDGQVEGIHDKGHARRSSSSLQDKKRPDAAFNKPRALKMKKRRRSPLVQSLLGRNRAAANNHKSRQREKEERLMAEIHDAEELHHDLHKSFEDLTNEVLSLRMEVLQHAHCDSPLIYRYINRTAQQHVESLPALSITMDFNTDFTLRTSAWAHLP